MEADFVSVGDAALELTLSPATVRRLIRTRKLGAVRVGERKWKIPRSALSEYLAQGASPALKKPVSAEGPAPSEGRNRAGD